VEVAAFWIALAAVLISGEWFRSRREAMKHETLRLMVEKTGRADEAQLRELFPLPHWSRQRTPGVEYRTMRVLGTLALFAALGLAVCFSILYVGYPGWRLDASIGFGVASVVAFLGVGLLVASRFVEKPPQQGDRD